MTPWFLDNLAGSGAAVSKIGTTIQATDIANLLSDEPGLVWRTDAVSSAAIIIDLGEVQAVDAVGLYWTNLRGTDKLRWRAATTEGNLVTAPVFDSGAVDAFAGVNATGKRTKHVLALASAQTARFWRVDVVASGLPFVEIGRVLIGRRVHLTSDMDMDAMQIVDDPSVIDEGPGYADVERFATRIGWRCQFSWIPDSVWRTNWFPFLQRIGKSRPTLFVPEPDNAAQYQDMVVYGRLRTLEGRHPIYDGWLAEIDILEISQ